MEMIIKIISIVIALITLIISLLKIYKHIVAREQKQQDMFERVFEELDCVKKRLDTHNNYAEKFSSVEKNMIIMQKDIEYIKEFNGRSCKSIK